MNNIRDTETITQMVIRMRKELLEQTRDRIEKEIVEDEQRLLDPKYNHFLIQHGISQHKGYLAGIKLGIEAIEDIERVNK